MPSKGNFSSRRLGRGLLVAVALAPMLAACATGQVRQADTRLPAAFEAPQPAAAAIPAPALDTWWRLYNDPQLTTLVEQALADSFDAKDAVAKLREAYAVRSAALLQYNPQGNLAVSATKQQYQLLNGNQLAAEAALATGGVGGGIGGGLGGLGAGLSSETNEAAFSVSWEADLFGRRNVARKGANADLRAAQFTYDAARWSLAANVADSLFQARGLAMQLAEAQETVRIDQQLYDIANLKAQHGLAATADATQTQSEVQSAQAQAESLRAQLVAARRSLLLLVGRGIDPLASLPVPAAVGVPPPTPIAAPGVLLTRRPDVREAQEQLVSATAKFALDKRALLPTFTLQPGVGLVQTSGANLSFWTLAANAAVPILDRPKLLAQVHQQRAVAEQAVIAYEKSVQTAYGEAETAFSYYDSDRQRVELLRSAEHNASIAYEARRTGYARGLNDLQTALNAEATWRQARVSLAGAQVTLMQRSVQLFKALGGGWAGAPAVGPA